MSDGPPIMAARTVWFHANDGLANALHAAACWIHDHANDGHIDAVLVMSSGTDAEGHDVVMEEPGAIERWSVGVVQER